MAAKTLAGSSGGDQSGRINSSCSIIEEQNRKKFKNKFPSKNLKTKNYYFLFEKYFFSILNIIFSLKIIFFWKLLFFLNYRVIFLTGPPLKITSFSQ